MRVVVVASGETADGDAAWLEGADLVIAADGGAWSVTGGGHAAVAPWVEVWMTRRTPDSSETDAGT